MQVKVCPKCKTENKPGNATCSSCYSPLEGVPVTLSAQQPAQNEQPAPTGDVGLAAGQVAPGGHSAPAPQATPPSPYGPPPGGPRPGGYAPPFREKPQPVKQGSNVGAVLLVLILLAGAGFAAWWFLLKPGGGPEATVAAFADALRNGDAEKAKTCLSKSTLELLNMMPGGFDASIQQEKNKNQDYTVVKTTIDGETATVEIDPADKSSVPRGRTTADIVLVKEDEGWKIDMMQTLQRTLGGSPAVPR